MKQKILNDSFITNAANLISQGLSLLQGFIILRFIDPGSYGVWLGLLILLRYGAYAHLGLEYGFMFRVPYYIGQNNAIRIQQVEDNTFIGWTVMTILFAIGVLGYYFMVEDVSHASWLGLIVILLMVFADQQSAFLNRWHTSVQKDFKSYGIVSIAKGILSFVIIVPLTYFFQIVGLMVGNLVVSILSAALWWARTSFRPRFELSPLILRELIHIGFPNLLIVLGGVLVETVDRILILGLLGAVNLGYYAITSMGGNSLYGLLAQAGAVMLPHIVEETGKHEKDFSVFEKYLIKPTVYLAYLSTLMLLLLYFIIPAIVESWLTEYVPGLSAFYLFIPGFFFLSIIITANNILNVILISQGRQYRLVAIQFFAVLVEIFAGYMMLQIGWGIAGVALGSTISYMVYGLIVLYLASVRSIQDQRSRWQFYFEVFAPFLYGIIVVLVLFNVGNLALGLHPLLRGIGQLILSAVCFMFLLPRLNKKYSLFTDVQAVPLLSKFTSLLSEMKKNEQR